MTRTLKQCIILSMIFYPYYSFLTNFKKYIYLKGSTERERVEIFYLLIRFSKDHNDQGWAMPKSRARNSTWNFPHGCRCPSTCAILRSISWGMDQKWINHFWSSMWGASTTGEGLECYASAMVGFRSTRLHCHFRAWKGLPGFWASRLCCITTSG